MTSAPALVLSLLAAGDGFGGQPEAAPSAPRPSPACEVQNAAGAWVSCDDLLNAPPPEPPSETLAIPPEGTGTILPPIRQRTFGEEHVETKSGFAEAFDKMKARVDGPSPLADLRAEVLEKAAWVQKHGRVNPDDTEAIEMVEALRVQRKLLDEVEVVGLRLREKCERSQLPMTDDDGWLSFLPEALGGAPPDLGGVYLTRGRRLRAIDPEVKVGLSQQDSERCQRVKMVTAEHIERVQRLHEVEAALAVDNFGFHRQADKDKLEKERREILQWLTGMERFKTATGPLEPLSTMSTLEVTQLK